MSAEDSPSPLGAPPGAAPRGIVTHVRSSLVLSSVQSIRARSLFDVYVRKLTPEDRGAILESASSDWLTMKLARAHYEACDALGLTLAEQIAIGGEVGDKVQKSFIGLLLRAARSAGATPWIVLGHMDRIWTRVFNGGGGAVVTKLGPKEATVRFVGLPIIDVPYLRNAFRGAFVAATAPFCEKSYVQELPAKRVPGGVRVPALLGLADAPNGQRRAAPLRQRPLLPIFLIVLVDIMGFTLVIPLLAIYAETYGASPFVATSLVSTYAACQLVSGPLLGRASDRVGRKPMLLVSQLGTLAGFLLLARKASALWVIFAARALDGATAGNLSLAQAYISDHTPPEKRASSFALIGIAFGIGFFLGPSMTGLLTPYGLAAPIYAAAGLSLHQRAVRRCSCCPGDDPRQACSSAPRPFRLFARPASLSGPNGPVLLGLLAQFFCFSVAFSTYMSGFALFSERRFLLARAPLRSARDRPGLRLRRVPRDHHPGRALPPPVEALRRVAAHAPRLLRHGASAPRSSERRARSRRPGHRGDPVAVRQLDDPADPDQLHHPERRSQRARRGARLPAVAPGDRADRLPPRCRRAHRSRLALGVGRPSAGWPRAPVSSSPAGARTR